ncbi:MAG: hypothetical protein RIS99_633 [Bacteroidota bacterium]
MTKLNIFLLLFCPIFLFSQEKTTVVSQNIRVKNEFEKRVSSRFFGRLDTLSLPFQDDFSSTEVFPNSSNWMDYQVYVNNHMSVKAPTLGVATFDGLNEQGMPYDIQAVGMSGPSDTLSSKAFNLLNRRGSDSIYLSFYYQAEGLGEAPEINDSLVVDLYNKNGFWNTVWGTPGTSVGVWKQVLIPVIDSNYLHAGFRFRIRNYSSLVGFLDHWHVDYVRLAANRLYNDTVVYDFAYSATPGNLLKNGFTQVPYLHFKSDSSRFLSNGHQTTFNVLGYGIQTIATAASYVEPRSGFQVHSQSLVANSSSNTRTYFPFSIPLIGTDSFELDAVYSIGSNSSIIKSNDTIKRRYLFYNQYAYDDGTAEYGYGLNTNGGRIAYRFISTRPDSLRGISLSFIPIKTDVSRELFTFMVWKSIPEPGTGKGEQLIYQSNFQKPKYQRFYNGFVNYEFDSAIAISDTFYIGWQQNTDKVLSLGLDRNDTANSNMFYNVTGTWQSSGIPGAWMMRPILGKRANLKIPTQELQRESISFYPNPAQETLYISGLNPFESPKFEIYSSMGQKMQSGFIFDGQIQLDPSLHGLMLLNILVKGERISFKFLKD